MKLNGREIVCKPDQIPLPDGINWTGVGSAWRVYEGELQQKLRHSVSDWHGDYYPHAQDIATLGIDLYRRDKAVGAEHAIPVYLRDTVVSVKQG